MNINVSVGKLSTSLRWEYLGDKVKVKLLGRASAEYSNSRELVITACTDGLIRIFKPDGKQVSEFSSDNPEEVKFYLLERTHLCDLGVRIIMAHTPEYKGERFWQHDIDINNQSISEPLAKWR